MQGPEELSESWLRASQLSVLGLLSFLFADRATRKVLLCGTNDETYEVLGEK